MVDLASCWNIDVNQVFHLLRQSFIFLTFGIQNLIINYHLKKLIMN
jgi:hypothetical protein